MAKKIVDLVAKDLLSEANNFPVSATQNYQLSGGEFKSDEDLQEFLTGIVTDVANAYLPNYFLHRWVFRYGRNTTQILEQAEALKSRYSDSEHVALAAEINYSYENEMIVDETDFAIRRTGMIYFDKIRLDRNLSFIHHYFNDLLYRSDAEMGVALKRFAEAVKEVTDFK